MNSSVEQGGSPLNSMAQAGEDDVLTGAAVPVAPAVTSPTDAPVVRAAVHGPSYVKHTANSAFPAE